MTSLIRTFTRVPRARLTPIVSIPPRRSAHEAYGNKMSGHEQGTHEKNPKQDMEHPGPKSPVEDGGSAQSQSQSSSSSSSSEQKSSGGGGGKQRIRDHISEAEEHDPEVKKHNEEMRNRADRSANQLSEKDNKVDKNFWKGDVGNIRGDQK